MNTSPASQQSLDSLCNNAGSIINEMYDRLCTEFQLECLLDATKSADEREKNILKTAFSLLIGVQFCLMDLESSLRVEILSQNGYEKRFHLKNLQGVISEGFKMIYGVKGTRNHSHLAKLKSYSKELNNGFDGALSSISSKLDVFETNDICKEVRDIVYHYDDDIAKVYDLTMQQFDEDAISLKACRFMEILQDLLNCLNDIIDEYGKLVQISMKDIVEKPLSIFDLGIHEAFIKSFKNNPKLKESIDYNLSTNGYELDNVNRTMLTTKKILDQLSNLPSSIDNSYPEIETLLKFSNTLMLLLFIICDVASVLRGYYNSASTIEATINMRRLCILRASCLKHLVGYNDNEKSKSCWNGIKEAIPHGNIVLLEEAENIELELKNYMERYPDNEIRELYVHYADNGRKPQNNIQETITQLRKINPAKESLACIELFSIINIIRDYCQRLFQVVAEKAHKDREKSEEQIYALFDKLEMAFNQLPKNEKQKPLADLKDLRTKLGVIINE